MDRFKLVDKMIAADGKTRLKVYANEGKKGIHLGVTIKAPGVPAKVGCNSTVETRDAAKAEFDRLVAEAKAEGWTPRMSSGGTTGRRSAFNSIPSAVVPTSAPAVQPDVPVSENVVPIKNGKKTKP